jgi:hypothetical protein
LSFRLSRHLAKSIYKFFELKLVYKKPNKKFRSRVRKASHLSRPDWRTCSGVPVRSIPDSEWPAEGTRESEEFLVVSKMLRTFTPQTRAQSKNHGPSPCLTLWDVQMTVLPWGNVPQVDDHWFFFWWWMTTFSRVPRGSSAFFVSLSISPGVIAFGLTFGFGKKTQPFAISLAREISGWYALPV